jgi:Domain of unknown function (DUF1707)/Cell wall-active antibiotics response 4TMS YvqF
VSENPDPDRMRASDADRERVAKVLQRAQADGRIDLHELDERLRDAYAAKTYGELAPLTADLPGLDPQAARPPVLQPPAGRLPARIGGGSPGPSTSIAVFTGLDRRGDWVVPATHTVVAIMGGVDIDLSTARFAEAETTITVFAFFGGVDIYVPEDVTVRVDGIGILGAFDDGTHTTPTVPGGPVVRITGMALMGGVDVRRPKIKKLRKKLHGGGHGELGH